MPATFFSSAFRYSLFLALLLAGTMLTQTLGWLAGFSLMRAALLLALPPAGWLTYSGAGKQDIRCALCLTLLLIAGGLLAIHHPDLTADALGYHQPAILALLQGFNPLRDTAELNGSVFTQAASGVWKPLSPPCSAHWMQHR